MRVTVRVRPAASRTLVGGAHDGALVVAVGAPAVDGRATQAALDAVADAFRVRSPKVRLVSGERSRTKIVEIDADDGLVAARLQELLDGGT